MLISDNIASADARTAIDPASVIIDLLIAVKFFLKLALTNFLVSPAISPVRTVNTPVNNSIVPAAFLSFVWSTSDNATREPAIIENDFAISVIVEDFANCCLIILFMLLNTPDIALAIPLNLSATSMAVPTRERSATDKAIANTLPGVSLLIRLESAPPIVSKALVILDVSIPRPSKNALIFSPASLSRSPSTVNIDFT